MSRTFYITDVFCEGRYSGNQLATVVDTAGLSGEEMQQIARAFNFAETTFLLGGNETSGYDVRIFTPATELPFAGHPVLGTAFLIRHLYQLKTTSLILNLGVGPIPVKFAEDGVIWMRQNGPTFRDASELAMIAPQLGLEQADLDPDFSPQFVSTGLEFLMVPVSSLAALKRCCSNPALDYGVFAFTREAYLEHHAIAARMFAGGLGVAEDAATGSANGCLASYAVEHHYLGNDEIDIQVGQGFEIARPSTLYLQARKANDEFEINVGGKVNLVASGQWQL